MGQRHDQRGDVNSVEVENKVVKSFDDSFVQHSSTLPKPYEPLPDSAEYLAGLEKKLDKIQKKKDSLLKDLKEKRQDEMRRLLDSELSYPNTHSDFLNSDPDTPISENAIVRRLAPHKQALTEEEKLSLLKEDQLRKTLEQQEEIDDQEKHSSDEKKN